MLLRFIFSVLLVGLAGPASAEVIFPGYEWREVTDDVYVHMRQNPFAGPVDGNSTVIVNEEDVFVVDTHINPAAARAIIEKIKSITDKPVTHIINTHWHDDHVNGNQAFQDAFPSVKILAHPNTVDKLKEEWEAFIGGRKTNYASSSPEEIYAAADALEADDPDLAIAYRVYAGYVEALSPELDSFQFAYPNELVEEQAVFVRRDREIVVEWIGAGNTDGDLIVWLPRERLLITGDMVTAPIPYAFSAPMIAWRETLDRLLEYDADHIIPGHGAPQNDETYVSKVAALIGETLDAVKRAADAGVAYESLSDAVDLEAQRTAFAGDDPIAVNAWNSYYVTPGLKSAWVALGLPVPEETSEETNSDD